MLRGLFEKLGDQGSGGGVLGRAVQAALGAATPFYAAGAAVHRLMFDAGLKKRHRLKAPVLSIGNITLGGTGKSPFAMWLSEWLAENGKAPAILTRGYGREDESKLIVVHDGKRTRATTHEAGDEPVMLARALRRVPVIACSSRYRAGRLATMQLGARSIILDDGFQHHALHREGDIVLLDATRPLRDLRLFPRGSLRELPAALQRADLIVITRWSESATARTVLREARHFAPQVPVVRTRLGFSEYLRLANGTRRPVVDLQGRTAYLACAVGNPEAVRKSMEELGLRVLGAHFLPDHERITKKQLLAIDSQRRRLGAEFLVVTEKDAVKLRELGRLPEELIAPLGRIEFITAEEEEAAIRAVRGMLARRPVKGLLR